MGILPGQDRCAGGAAQRVDVKRPLEGNPRADRWACVRVTIPEPLLHVWHPRLPIARIGCAYRAKSLIVGNDDLNVGLSTWQGGDVPSQAGKYDGGRQQGCCASRPANASEATARERTALVLLRRWAASIASSIFSRRAERGRQRLRTNGLS